MSRVGGVGGGFCSPRTGARGGTLRGSRFGAAAQVEFGGGRPAGVQAPEIDGKLPGDGDDGFLPGRAGGFGTAGEDREAF